MEQSEIIATTVANELGNVVNEATSINENQIEMTEEKNEVVRTTRIAIINGEEVEIVVAHTEYGMELPKDRKKLKESLDKSKMLSCIYHLAKPEIFWDAEIELLDENNQPIEKGTENVYVLCPTADSYWRVAVDEKLERVEIHDFANVQEYAQVVGCTNLCSRGLNNTEKMGMAALATGDDACRTVFEFAKEHKVNISTAKHYLDYSVKPSAVVEMMIGNAPESAITLGRAKEEAEILLEVATEKFGKYARKRYVMRAINPLLRDDYSMEQMLEAIKQVSGDEIMKIEFVPSGEKESKISSTLTKHLERIKSGEIAQTDFPMEEESTTPQDKVA